MRLLLLISLFLVTCHSNVLDEVKEWLAIENHYELTTPPEKAEFIMEDLFRQHPSLKPAKEKDVIELKKSFMTLIKAKSEQRDKILSGSQTNHKAFGSMIESLKETWLDEYEDLEDRELEYLQNINFYVWHKLSAQASLKHIKQKREEYKRRNMSDDEIKMDVISKGASIFASWHKGLQEDEMIKQWKRMMDEL